MSRNHKPSDFYPDYFKLDLRIGSENAHPFARALDDFISQSSDYANQFAQTLNPAQMQDGTRTEALNFSKFQTDTLNEEKREQLLNSLPIIYQSLGSLKSLSILADIYFGAHTIHRGNTQAKSEKGTLVLGDRQSSENLIFIRLEQESSEVKTIEYCSNAQHLLPDSYRVKIANPIKSTPEKKLLFNLGKKTPLKKRRLSCHISLK